MMLPIHNLPYQLANFNLDELTGCWIWKTDRVMGYILIRSPFDGKHVLLHRLVYEWFFGPLPHGIILHHKCFRPPCINPFHMQPVTKGQHMRIHAKVDPEVLYKMADQGVEPWRLAIRFKIGMSQVYRLLNRRKALLVPLVTAPRFDWEGEPGQPDHLNGRLDQDEP